MTTTSTTPSWYALCATEESRTRTRIFRLSPAAWRAEATQLLRQSHPHRIASTLAFVRSMDEMRAASPAAPAPPHAPEVKSESDLDWSVWRNMVEDPAKYGDDIIEWLDLDEKLRAGPKRWRVEAYWLQKEQEKEEETKRKEEAIEAVRAPYKVLYSRAAKQAAAKGMQVWIARDIKNFLARIRNAATKIQAAVRGYQARSKLTFLNCCMCLSHRMCPLETQVGMICRACGEQGPYEDITGPVSDPWNWARADFTDLAPANIQLSPHERAIETANYNAMLWIQNNYPQREEELERCTGCGTWYPEGEMDSCPGYGSYCSRSCGPSGYARDFGTD